MLDTLFNTKFQFTVYLGIGLSILLFFPGLSIFSYIALMITLHQFMLLFNSIGHIIPVRYLFGSFMCLQMFLGPTFAFNGLDAYQIDSYKMQVSEDTYFTYVIPAVICFIIGLHINAKKFEGEIINLNAITRFSEINTYLPYYLIAIGFIASLLNLSVSSELTFVFTLLSGFSFVGVFLLILGKTDVKPLPMALVIGATISSTLAGGMFHDLLIWLIFTLSIFAIRFKPSTSLKLLATVIFVLLAITIQQLKGDYRQATWSGNQEAGVDAFQNVLESSQEKGTFFSKKKLSESNIRINQGFIVTHIMNNIPAKVPFSEGDELKEILEAAFLPRFLAPNKLNAGSRELFVKYSGMPLKKGTSMGLSSVGDAYVNFGTSGGAIFMFVLGFMFSKILQLFFTQSRKFPMLILFVPLIFYYPIRPDCELQTILGHLVKGTFLVFSIMFIFKGLFGITDDDTKPTKQVVTFA